MSKNIKQANKLITKATTVFGSAVVQVEKANELLKKDIEKDTDLNLTDQSKILELEAIIENRRNEIKAKSEQINSNKVLVEQLKTFVPQK